MYVFYDVVSSSDCRAPNHVMINESWIGMNTEAIVQEGPINITIDLQETKFLRLLGLTNVHY